MSSYDILLFSRHVFLMMAILYIGYNPFLFWIWLQSLYDFWDMDMIQGLCSRFHMALLAYGHPFSYMVFLDYANMFLINDGYLTTI